MDFTPTLHVAGGIWFRTDSCEVPLSDCSVTSLKARDSSMGLVCSTTCTHPQGLTVNADISLHHHATLAHTHFTHDPKLLTLKVSWNDLIKSRSHSHRFCFTEKGKFAGWACGIKFWGPDSKRQRWRTEVTLTQGSQPNLTGYWLNCWIKRVRWCWLFSFVLSGKLGVLISFASFLTRSNVPSVTWKPPSDFQVWLLPDCEIDGCPGIPSRLIWGKTDIATATGCLS